jgi:RNA recognition motif-containing protein
MDRAQVQDRRPQAPRAPKHEVYVGNIPYETTEEDVRQHFSSAGEVVKVTLCKDRDTGRAKGFGFVEFTGAEGVEAAIADLNGTDIGGRTIRVDKAKGGK